MVRAIQGGFTDLDGESHPWMVNKTVQMTCELNNNKFIKRNLIELNKS